MVHNEKGTAERRSLFAVSAWGALTAALPVLPVPDGVL